MAERSVGQYTYNASRTEVLTEELCESFGTKLLPAQPTDYFPDILTRLSQPSVVEHRNNGKKHLFEIQFSKFSPLYSHRLLDVWNANRPKGTRPLHDRYKIYQSIQENGKTPVGLILDANFLPQAPLNRYKKELYISVFDVTGLDLEDIDLKPFNIFSDGGMFSGQFSDLFIRYARQEIFFINQTRETQDDQSDPLEFIFPKTKHEHDRGLSHTHVLADSPLKNDNYTQSVRLMPWEQYRLPVKIPPESVIKFIQSYLRGRFTGTSLV